MDAGVFTKLNPAPAQDTLPTVPDGWAIVISESSAYSYFGLRDGEIVTFEEAVYRYVDVMKDINGRWQRTLFIPNDHYKSVKDLYTEAWDFTYAEISKTFPPDFPFVKANGEPFASEEEYDAHEAALEAKEAEESAGWWTRSDGTLEYS